MIKILGLCGSLRLNSRSRSLLQASVILAGPEHDFALFESLGDLPLFNPDITQIYLNPYFVYGGQSIKPMMI